MGPRPATSITEMDGGTMIKEVDVQTTKQQTTITKSSCSGGDQMLSKTQQQQQNRKDEEEEISLSSSTTTASSSIATPKDLSLSSNHSSQHSCSSSIASSLLLVKHSSNSSLMMSSSRIRQLKIQRQLQLSRTKSLLEMNQKESREDRSFLLKQIEDSQEEMNNLKKAVSLLEECHARNQRLIQRNQKLESALMETRQKRKATDKKYRAAIRRLKQLEEEKELSNRFVLNNNHLPSLTNQEQERILSSSSKQPQEVEQSLEISKTQQQQDDASSVDCHTSQLSNLRQQQQQQQQKESSSSALLPNIEGISNNNIDKDKLHLSMELKKSHTCIKQLQNENLRLREQLIEQQQQQRTIVEQQQQGGEKHNQEQEQQSEIIVQSSAIKTSSANKAIVVQQAQQQTHEETSQQISSSNKSAQTITEGEGSSSNANDLEYYKQLSVSLAKKLDETKQMLATEWENKASNNEKTIQREEVVEDAISNYFDKIYNPLPNATTKNGERKATTTDQVESKNSKDDQDTTLLALSLVASAKNRFRKSIMPSTSTRGLPRSSFAEGGRSFTLSRITAEPDDIHDTSTQDSRMTSSSTAGTKSHRSSVKTSASGRRSNHHVDPDETYFDAGKSIANLLYNDDNIEIEVSASSSTAFVEDSATKLRPSFWGSLFQIGTQEEEEEEEECQNGENLNGSR